MAEDNIWGVSQEDEGTEIPVEFVDEETDGEETETVSKEEEEEASESKEDAADTEAAPGEEQGETAKEEDICEEPDVEETEQAAPSSEEEEEETQEEGSEEKEEEAQEHGSEEKETGEEAETHKKTSFFGRMKNKEKEKYEQLIEELNDKLRRSLAEFDNFRKRTEKEKASMYVIGARDIVEKILPVVDSFERGLAQAGDNPEDPFVEGMQMIYKQLMTALEEVGVKQIEAVGQQFDPNLHNAVMHVDDEEAGENVVVEEFQKGYTYKDFVVRHSMVKVAN